MAEGPIVYTIGFTKTSAEHFFDRLKRASVRQIIDVRLHNTSQLSGFAKSDDLAYFLRAIDGVDYIHLPILAPEPAMLDDYKKKKGSWKEYEQRFLSLMAERKIEEKISPSYLAGACLLCSEQSAHHCHRRLVCDYLSSRWGGSLAVRHL